MKLTDDNGERCDDSDQHARKYACPCVGQRRLGVDQDHAASVQGHFIPQIANKIIQMEYIDTELCRPEPDRKGGIGREISTLAAVQPELSLAG